MRWEHLDQLYRDDLKAVEAAAADILQNSFPAFGRRLHEYTAAPGKGIRALMLLAFAESRGPCRQRAIRYAAALELIHLSSLIHDDIIDESTERRGQPALHCRQGLKFAVLSGDYIAVQALRAALELNDLPIAQIFTRAAASLIYGEIDQWEKKRLPGGEEAAYLEMIGHKTAGLFQAAAQVGGRLSGLEGTDLEQVRTFGRCFGMGFQLVDDLVDLGQGTAAEGKTLFRDPANGLPTLPRLRSLEYTLEKARDYFRQGGLELKKCRALPASLLTQMECLGGHILARVRPAKTLTTV
jgi:octaprenyl-diphosphate synthase